MRYNRFSKASFIFTFLVFVSNYTFAEKLRVSIPHMPVHAESADKGILVDFAKALAKKLQQDIDIQIVPFSRSIYYVSTNKVDFHLPFIKANIKPPPSPVAQKKSNNEQKYKQAKEYATNFIYSDETINHVNFVLYSHKDSLINIDKIHDYKIETDTAHLSYFDGVDMASDCILCSLKKVQFKMTDGYIFADSSTDPLLRLNKKILPNIKRQLYQRFEVKVLFPNTEQGHKLNKRISAVISEMRSTGELAKLLSSIDLPYEDWQLQSAK